MTSFAQASETLIPSAQDVASLEQVFSELGETSCPTQYNFHMHTVCSDGRLPPEQLMEQAVRIGLRGLAITDHHTTKGFHRASRWLEMQVAAQGAAQPFPHLWTGVEISAGLLDDEVHLLCYGFDPYARVLQPYLQGKTVTGPEYEAGRVIEAAHQAGGLAVLAHPARYRRSPADLISCAVDLGIDGVESYYAYNNPDPWRPSPQQMAEVKAMGDRHGLFSTCGTDTHGLNLLKRL
jgi:predicted metal-dependent phosphoesterase TrpH